MSYEDGKGCLVGMDFEKTLLVTVTEWYRTKHPMHCGHLLIYCAFPAEFQSFMNYPPDFSGKYQHKHLVTKQGQTWRETSVNFDAEVSLILLRDFYHAVRSYDMGPTALIPFRRKAATDFYSPCNSIVLDRVEPANLECSSKHDNHYITENDSRKYY
jgi:hypothetical protein